MEGTAVIRESTVSILSPARSVAPLEGGPAAAHGAAVDTPERFARASDARLGGRLRIKPGALDAGRTDSTAPSSPVMAATSAGRRRDAVIVTVE